MEARVAVIAGTGISGLLTESAGAPIHVPTPFGRLRARLLPLGKREGLLVARHGEGHLLPPHRVNYRAMAAGLSRLGVRFCLAGAAVGSLRNGWAPGTFAVCSDFIELSGRAACLHEDAVCHTDFSCPFDGSARRALLEAGGELGIPVQESAVYVCANGPRYETPAEIELYRRLGGDVIGMTAGTEAVAMCEAGVGYACLAVVTNMATGLADAFHPHPALPLQRGRGFGGVSHQDVTRAMQGSGEQAVAILKRAAERLSGP